MKKEYLTFKDEQTQKDFKELWKVSGEVAVDVNHIMRVNGSAPFPISPKALTGVGAALKK